MNGGSLRIMRCVATIDDVTATASAASAPQAAPAADPTMRTTRRIVVAAEAMTIRRPAGTGSSPRRTGSATRSDIPGGHCARGAVLSALAYVAKGTRSAPVRASDCAAPRYPASSP